MQEMAWCSPFFSRRNMFFLASMCRFQHWWVLYFLWFTVSSFLKTHTSIRNQFAVRFHDMISCNLIDFKHVINHGQRNLNRILQDRFQTLHWGTAVGLTITKMLIQPATIAALVFGVWRPSLGETSQAGGKHTHISYIYIYLFIYIYLRGGFKYFLFSPLFGEDFQFDEHIFLDGWFNHQPDIYIYIHNTHELFFCRHFVYTKIFLSQVSMTWFLYKPLSLAFRHPAWFPVLWRVESGLLPLWCPWRLRPTTSWCRKGRAKMEGEGNWWKS